MLPLPDLHQLAAQHFQTGLLILELAALGLAGHHDAGGLVNQPDGGGGLVDVLTARAGGAVDLHFIVLGPDLEVLGVILDLGNHFDGGKRGLPPGVGVKGGHPHQPVDAVLPLQEAVGVFAGDHDGGGLDSGLVALLVVQDLIAKAVTLRPSGVHPVEHLAPVLGLGAAGAGLEAHNGIVAVILAGEQRLQAAGLHLLGQPLEALLQLGEHGVVVLLGSHLADGHQVVPVGGHFLEPLDFGLRLPGLDHDLLALLWVVPEAGGLLHGVKPLQLITQPLQI